MTHVISTTHNKTQYAWGGNTNRWILVNGSLPAETFNSKDAADALVKAKRKKNPGDTFWKGAAVTKVDNDWNTTRE